MSSSVVSLKHHTLAENMTYLLQPELAQSDPCIKFEISPICSNLNRTDRYLQENLHAVVDHDDATESAGANQGREYCTRPDAKLYIALLSRWEKFYARV